MRVLSAPSTGTAVLRGDGDTGRRGRLGDRGQVAVEFLGMLPLIAAVCVILWQSALLGYTYILAGDAADSAAREGAVGLAGQAQCQAAAREDLGTWREGASVSCGSAAGGLYEAEVELKVPVLFPGFVSFPFHVTGHAATVEEGW
ncbi:TadE/TadG family type IV pilus assembly protein [Streptomyces zhihengii]|nr:TadE/TadG family type IV pilus assembly protein [Streptomyces zhihengii]